MKNIQKKSSFYIFFLLLIFCILLITLFQKLFKNHSTNFIMPKILNTTNVISLYISNDGSDYNDGSKNSPLKSISGLNNILYKYIDSTNLNSLTINIYRDNGTYKFTNGFALDGNSFKDKNISINFIGLNKSKVIFTGGYSFSQKDSSKYDWIKNIYKYDISNITNFSSDLISLGIHDLYINGSPMTLSRYPNNGFILINSLLSNQTFTINDNTPFSWTSSKDVFLNGYLAYDWNYSSNNIVSIDSSDKTISIINKLQYGINNSQRIYFSNIFEELDTKLEYYIDYDNSFIYFIPKSRFTNSTLTIPILSEPFISLNNCNNISFNNITFEYSRNTGIVVENSSNILLNNLVIRNMSGKGVDLQSVYDTTISNCKLYNLGFSGVDISGGNRIGLESSNSKAINNEIYNFAIKNRTYSPGVSAYGVGILISNNKISNSPHSAIIFNGNDHIIENNEIFNVCNESGDSGAIYSGNDWTYRGNIIRSNYIHDVGYNSPNNNIVGIYLDDCMSSAEVYDNTLERINIAILVGGGRDNIITKNIIKKCNKSILIDNRALDWLDTSTLYNNLEKVPYTSELWLQKYPELYSLINSPPEVPYGNKVNLNSIILSPQISVAKEAKSTGYIDDN